MRNHPLRVLALLATLCLLPGYSYADSAKTGVYQATIPLGSAADLTRLYSYPNKPGAPATLGDTIAHYTTQSAQRDGLPQLTVKVQATGGRYSAEVKSSSYRVLDYARRLPAFLAIGTQAVAATAQIKQDGKWNAGQWRMFLPLGLALVDQRSVQLLHFPPDYSLPDQNYLGSKTSRRWESLLEENGVPPSQVTRYEAIVDIAPIAAPADAGNSLEATYPYSAPYARNLLEFLTHRRQGAARPVVAYGYPVRKWVDEQYHLSLKVLGTGTLKLADGVSAPVIGANHPSFIWYVKDQGFAAAEQVMYQDLAAACWQMKMGENPDADPAQTVKRCGDGWHTRPTQVCELTWEQAFDKTPQQAQKLCGDHARRRRTPTVDLERLERQYRPR